MNLKTSTLCLLALAFPASAEDEPAGKKLDRILERLERLEARVEKTDRAPKSPDARRARPWTRVGDRLARLLSPVL